MTRIPQIRSVKQPYNSFGGISKESDEDFTEELVSDYDIKIEQLLYGITNI